MVTAYLGLGSNQGDREKNLARARQMLGLTPGVVLRRASGLYLTEPVGRKDQPWFLNQVLAVDTLLSARGLLHAAKRVESIMGRVAAERWGPRIIDVDVLLYGSQVIKEADLEVPHAGLYGRAFVLIPLAEIASDLRLPNGKTVAELSRQKFSEAVLPWQPSSATIYYGPHERAPKEYRLDP
ncbi:MAG: 2-amino-4-hydroxy-6-hydroxymethyldihydropteridine diphosphokinase [Clostridia bacterium]|jgi:2-amino-4-hydroxy-6-hydroxymethyldihydropteridine diphosphokinase|nr:2-amino-4-hydroxy-6-hydroxymethyldihydropteridine diphosphokinase [Clostridia bacterium]MDH7573346.1 2-amino-4-hydroxy-6-hydroxymethyldihydropteridine diphosphokinase [Clostridia bacterium]